MLNFQREYNRRDIEGQDLLIEEATLHLKADLAGIDMTEKGKPWVHGHPHYDAYHTQLTMQFVKEQLARLARHKETITEEEYISAVQALRKKKADWLLVWCDDQGIKPKRGSKQSTNNTVNTK